MKNHFKLSVPRTASAAFAAILMSTVVVSTAGARSVLEKLDEAIAAMATYRSGDSPESLELVYGLTVKSQASDAARRAMAERLAGMLDGQATLEARIFACKQLHLIGGDESVPVLSRYLQDPELAEVALYALDGIRTPAADRALRQAVEVAPDNLKVSIVHSLAERRDAYSVNTLSGLVYKRDDNIAAAAIQALGRIGDEQAARAIARARDGAPAPRKVLLTEALLDAAATLQSRGNAEEAAVYFGQLYQSPDSAASRLTAFRGLAEALGDNAAPVIVDALKSNSYELAAAACGFINHIDGAPSSTSQFANALPNLDASVQPLLLDALAERGDAKAAPVVRSFAQVADDRVRHAALHAVAKLGDASDVALLHAALTKDEAVATEALARLSGDGVSDAIVHAASTGTTESRVPLIVALGTRGEPDTITSLLHFAHDGDPRIREAAFDACASAGDASCITEIAALLVKETDDDARTGAERALIALSKHNPATAVIAMDAAIPAVKRDEATYSSVLRVLAATEHPEALDALRDAAKSRDDSIRKTAVAALSNWPNAEPLGALERLAKGRKDDPIRMEAFRGYIQLLRLPSDRSTKQSVKLYTKARKLAETADDKKLLLAGLAEVPDQAALKLVRKYAGDRDVREEAALAIQRIEKSAYSAIASHNAADAGKAFDSNIGTRWATGASQAPGQWFQLDLGWTRTLSGLELDATNSSEDYPRGFEVYLSNDAEHWGDPVAQGRGTESVTAIAFKSRKARYIKIVQTGSVDNRFWSIDELTIAED